MEGIGKTQNSAWKEFYYSLEERYYTVLDDANKVLPVYDFICPIDKAFPSFLLFVGMAAVVGVALIMYGGV
ncbi:MAG: hypothetical protein ABH854_02390 [Candidatus Diapherotrites archaeon]|nr:hypothetical protein [Candidatus Micrarchaeota archaeon]